METVVTREDAAKDRKRWKGLISALMTLAA